MRNPPEATGEVCRIPGCDGEIFQSFTYVRRHNRIGARDPAWAKVKDKLFCKKCGVVYAFAKAKS